MSALRKLSYTRLPMYTKRVSVREPPFFSWLLWISPLWCRHGVRNNEVGSIFKLDKIFSTNRLSIFQFGLKRQPRTLVMALKAEEREIGEKQGPIIIIVIIINIIIAGW